MNLEKIANTAHAEKMTRQNHNIRNEITSILKNSIQFDIPFDWGKLIIQRRKSEFIPSIEPPEFPGQKAKGFSFNMTIFGKDTRLNDSYEEAVTEYSRQYREELRLFVAEKMKNERIMRKNNSDILFLREHFDLKEKAAIQEFSRIILTKSPYPDFLKHSFEVKYSITTRTLKVDFLMPNISSFSSTDKFEILPKTNKVTEVFLAKKDFNEFYEKTLFSIAIRSIYELFSAIYIDGVDFILFNGFLKNANAAVDSIADSGRCIFTIKAERNLITKSDITDGAIWEILSKIQLRRIKNFTDLSEIMAPLKD